MKCVAAITLLMLPLTPGVANAQFDLEEPPLSYTDTKDDNPVRRLIGKYDSGAVDLEYDRNFGYLRAVLEALDIHESTQALVFSKTSMQVRYISPRTPRAIFFNDDVYVGWVRGSEIMELSSSDPKLGAAFYTVTMSPQQAVFKRAGYECLGCHATSMTQGVPGHTVRSVFPDPGGAVDPRRKSYISDHTSPLSERWGGWYVTGLHGEMTHMGNAFLRGGRLDRTDSANLPNLQNVFSTIGWPSSYSDIVGLMVLEHQTQMHNIFTKANFTTRCALHDLNSAPSTAETSEAELDAVVAAAAKEVVDYMLFVDEAPLTSDVKGSLLFRIQFRRRGPDDEQGRSLREFDLKSRLFRYPCSYMIYSQAFDTLEDRLRTEIYTQLWKILNASEPPPRFQHLDAETQTALRDILRDTKPTLAEAWKQLEIAAATKDTK